MVLPNSRTPRVREARDMGELSPDTSLSGITLVFRRSVVQETMLKELLAAQQNPASPLYHQWLSVDSFATRFGVAEEDIATTENWLVARGFHIDGVAQSRDRITFSGTAAQVQAAFGTELRHYETEGELHFAPATDLTLPANLAAVTAAVLHLSDFRPSPSVIAQVRPQPNYTTLSTQAHFLTPRDLVTMYNLTPIYRKGFSGGGQSLAVVGQSFVDTTTNSKIDTFQTLAGGRAYISSVLVPGTGVQAISPGDQGESELDLEYSSGLAGNATVFFVYVGSNRNYSVFDALAFAITQNIAPVISISYGACESVLSGTDLDQMNALFEEAAAQGQTLVAASGDTGSTTCAMYSSGQGITTQQQQSLSVSFPASSPYVTAVGGTQMAAGTFAPGSSSYWASASYVDEVGSLLSYVPEVVWNEGSTSRIAAGGGGTSVYFPRPAWQSGVSGITNGSYRLLPDISLQSSFASPGFGLCTNDRSLFPQGQTASCTNGLLGSNGQYTVAGGTSFAAPIFAGFLAVLNQTQHATGQGNINPVLYGLAANPNIYAAAFHDITLGTNGCVPGATNCSAGGASNYAATPGYDLATGLGSVDFNELVSAWPSSGNPNLAHTTTLVSGPSATDPGSTASIVINVQRTDISTGAPVPSGTLSIEVDGVASSATLVLVPKSTLDGQSTATYNFVVPSIPGSHLVRITYPGDAIYSSSTATHSVMVGNVRASGGISVAVGNITIANGGTGTTQVTVSPTGGYNGRVVWGLTVTGGSASLTGCFGISSLPVSNVSTTQLTIGVGAACGSSLPAARIALPHESAQIRWRGTPATAVYATFLICGALARRRKILPPSLLAIVFLAVVGAGLTGCGGSSGNTGTNPMTPATPSSTSYTMTLTGTDSVNSSITGRTSFTLTIN